MRRALKALAGSCFRVLPPEVRRRVIRVILYAVTRQSPPAALRELLQVESDLSASINETALAYDGGIHPKHRLTGYHDFFVARVRPGERVLDLGCGYGAVAYALASRAGALVTGIDLSEANIALARQRFRHAGLRFIVGDATRDLPEEGFDVIVASNIIEHLEDRVGFVRKVQACARPRCWLVRVPLLNRDWLVPLRAELGLPHFSDSTHCTEYTRESFEIEMHAAGMRILDLQIGWGEIWAEVVPR